MKRITQFMNVCLSRLTLMYTILVIVLSVSSVLIKNLEVPAVLSGHLMYTLLFSFLTSLSVTLCDLIKNNAIIKNALKFLLVYASFALCFFVGVQVAGQNKLYTISMLSLMFVISYVFVALIKTAVMSVLKKNKNKNTEYTSVFTGSESK